MARDPGAASALVPVALRWPCTVIGLDDARAVFERAGIRLEGPHSDPDADTLAQFVRAINPAVLLTGTSRRDRAPLDARWWHAARDAGIPSVALLDHWTGYWERFTIETRFDAMPDVIAVMDDYAREQLISSGCRDARIVVTGHPGFDSLIKSGAPGRDDARARWSVQDAEQVVLFASEPIAADIGHARGYDEADVLLMLLDALRDRPCRLVIKTHPREPARRLERLVAGHQRTATVETALTGREAVAGADAVVGMTSVLLLEAAIAGRPVLSIQPGVREPWTDHFQTLITTVESVEGARAWLEDDANRGVLTPEARLARVRRAGFDERGTATDNVLVILSAPKDLHLKRS